MVKTLYIDHNGMPHQPHQPMAPRSELIRVAVDLDGTLAHGTWSPSNPTAELGEPIWRNVKKLDELSAAGYKIWIHTARPDADYEAIEAWLNHYGILFSGIVTGKILAVAYIDDRGVHEADNWLEQVNMIEAQHG